MGSHSPRPPRSVLFLLLLLLPLPLLRAWSLQHHGPSGRRLHRPGKGSRSSHQDQDPHARQHWRRQQGDDCQGDIDLYLILDKSGSVGNNWNFIYNMVEEMVKRFTNPNLRLSFILYSTDAETLMPLTSDIEDIRNGLSKLQRVVPEGITHMQEGFKKANEQIRNIKASGNPPSSVIVALTDGTLMTKPYKETLEEARKAREMGAVVYTVGVFHYNEKQMIKVADSPQHMFGVTTGFTGLQSIIELLTSKFCIQVTSMKPSSSCAGEPYIMTVSGRGFENARGLDQVVCRFSLSDSNIVSEKATSMTNTAITCPGPVLDKPGQTVLTSVSLNNGISFIRNQLSITAQNCFKGRKLFLIISMVVGLLLFPLLLWGVWRLCCGKRVKEPPPEPQPEQKPEEENFPPPPPPVPPPVSPLPNVIVACCGCRDRVIERDPVPCCNYFSPSCQQVPLMWCQPRVQGRCTNFSIVNPSCTLGPCSPKIYLPPSRECRQCFQLTQSPCTPRICLGPRKECSQMSQAPCTPKICLRASRECFPIAQTLGTPRTCLRPTQACLPLNSYAQCHYLPPRCIRSSSRMLPLVPPSARQSVESLGQCYPCRPTSRRPKP